jgi:hypothetical protein
MARAHPSVVFLAKSGERMSPRACPDAGRALRIFFTTSPPADEPEQDVLFRRVATFTGNAGDSRRLQRRRHTAYGTATASLGAIASWAETGIFGFSVTADELPAGHEALVVQQLKPGSCSLDAIPLLEQFEPRRPNTVKAQPREPGLRVTRIPKRPHRMNRLRFGDEARLEDDLADAPTYRPQKVGANEIGWAGTRIRGSTQV